MTTPDEIERHQKILAAVGISGLTKALGFSSIDFRPSTLSDLGDRLHAEGILKDGENIFDIELTPRYSLAGSYVCKQAPTYFILGSTTYFFCAKK